MKREAPRTIVEAVESILHEVLRIAALER